MVYYNGVKGMFRRVYSCEEHIEMKEFFDTSISSYTFHIAEEEISCEDSLTEISLDGNGKGKR